MRIMTIRRPPLPLIFLIGYIGVLWYSLWDASLPSVACSDGNSTRCVRPLIKPMDRVALELWTFQPVQNDSDTRFRWIPVESCRFNVTLPSLGVLPREATSEKENCTLTLPDVARIRWSDTKSQKGGPLRAKFVIRQLQDDPGRIGKVVVEVPLELARIVESSSSFATVGSSTGDTKARNLLEEPIPVRDGSDKVKHKYIPYLKYGTEPIVLRFVAEERQYGGPPYMRKDGITMSIVSWNQSAYRPRIYVDENALQRSRHVEIAPPEEGKNKPPVNLRIQIGTLSPIVDAFNQQLTMGLSMAESTFVGGELDEIRYWLKDERLYRFALTQVISFIHVWVDFLAFRDEVRFYRGRTNFAGVSVWTVSTRLVCSIIIFLYLMDGGGSSWVVLLSVASGVAVDAWKAVKLLRPSLKPSYPFVVFRVTTNPIEQETAKYDRIAIYFLSLFLYPCVAAWAFYALKHYVYRSWYSWLISNLANAVYTFGFIALCPQLYINYRLKSVAHLPWKVFMYKVFNTFVDDVFAFLIEMPWKHRIMTLRDDFVFVLFLIQAYIYRVDKSRANEYGYAYEEDSRREATRDDFTKVKDKVE